MGLRPSSRLGSKSPQSVINLLIIALIGWLLTFSTYAEANPKKTVKVVVIGCVARGNIYHLDSPATIEQALAKAGGWSGQGDFGMPANVCSIRQRRNSQEIRTNFAISVDRQTKKITVVDEEWKHYHLTDGDLLVMPEIVF